jgi:hypothetical protein
MLSERNKEMIRDLGAPSLAEELVTLIFLQEEDFGDWTISQLITLFLTEIKRELRRKQ